MRRFLKPVYGGAVRRSNRVRNNCSYYTNRQYSKRHSVKKITETVSENPKRTLNNNEKHPMKKVFNEHLGETIVKDGYVLALDGSAGNSNNTLSKYTDPKKIYAITNNRKDYIHLCKNAHKSVNVLLGNVFGLFNTSGPPGSHHRNNIFAPRLDPVNEKWEGLSLMYLDFTWGMPKKEHFNYVKYQNLFKTCTKYGYWVPGTVVAFTSCYARSLCNSIVHATNPSEILAVLKTLFDEVGVSVKLTKKFKPYGHKMYFTPFRVLQVNKKKTKN